LLGRWNYDIQKSRTIETFGGVEFNDCCWQIRLVGRQFLSDPASLAIDDTESDRGVFLQVVLKGLAGLGGRIDTLLENGIRGYTPEEY
jgi:LPS-assembly protein